jgi:hypothetical protein
MWRDGRRLGVEAWTGMSWPDLDIKISQTLASRYFISSRDTR